MFDPTFYPAAAGMIQADDFGLEKHRRIFRRMGEIQDRGETIDRLTVFHELEKHGEREGVGGLGYLAELDEGLPHLPNVEAYARIIRDKSILRRIIAASEHLASRAEASNAEPTALLAEANSSLLALAEKGAESTLQPPRRIIEEGGGLSVYLDRRNRTTGTPSGFPTFDVMTGGFKPGGLYIVAARPSMGKTAFALNIAERAAVDREAIVPIFSLEMDRQSLVDRLICSRARVDTSHFEGGYLDADERKRVGRAAGEIAVDGRILIDDRANTNTQEIHAKIRKQQARGPVGLVILDYLQLLIGGDDAHRVASASRISRELKLIAKDCKVPMLALAQLSRACETRTDKRPILSDLRETGAIEQDGDVVAMLYREEVYSLHSEEHRGEAELIVRKHRGGPTGTIPLTWMAEIVRFEERARGSAI